MHANFSLLVNAYLSGLRLPTAKRELFSFNQSDVALFSRD